MTYFIISFVIIILLVVVMSLILKNAVKQVDEKSKSYFVDKLKVDDLQNSYNNIVKYEILPLLKEYWIDDEDKIKEYSDML